MADNEFPTGTLMKGKRGLIMGVANKNSIAWGIAQQLHAQAPSWRSPIRMKRWKSACVRWWKAWATSRSW